MREKLAEINNHRAEFTATFSRFGQKAAYKGPPIVTALFLNVCDRLGNQMTDHIWFKVGIQMRRLNLQPGDKIIFQARVSKYFKGYRGRRDDEAMFPGEDYGLRNPSRVEKLTEHLVDSMANMEGSLFS